MAIKKTALTLAMGTAFAASLAATPVVNAAESPFAMQSLDKGYMVAEAADKTKSTKGAKAAEAKCGSSMESTATGDKMKDGKCGNTAKMKDGKCGEGKCGATKAKADAKK